MSLVCFRCGTPYGHGGGGHCKACHRTFTSDSAFDRHRTGPYTDRRCLTGDEMAAAGWRLTRAGWTPYPPRTDAPWGQS